MDERDLLPVSIRSGANFNVYPQYSRIEDRVVSLKDFCTVSAKRLLTQRLLQKFKVRLRTHKIYTQNLPPPS